MTTTGNIGASRNQAPTTPPSSDEASNKDIEVQLLVPGQKLPDNYVPRPRPVPRLRPPQPVHRKGLVRRFHDKFHIHEEMHKANDRRREDDYQAAVRAWEASNAREVAKWEDEQKVLRAALKPQTLRAVVPLESESPKKTEMQNTLDQLRVAMKIREAQRQEALKDHQNAAQRRRCAFEEAGKAQVQGDEDAAYHYVELAMEADDDIKMAQQKSAEAFKYHRMAKKTIADYERRAMSVHDRKLLSEVGTEIARLCNEEQVLNEQADGNTELDDEFWNHDMSRDERREKLLAQAADWAAPREAVIQKPQPVVQPQNLELN